MLYSMPWAVLGVLKMPEFLKGQGGLCYGQAKKD